MHTLQIRSKEIGKGRPKTIVPIVAATHQEILDAAIALKEERFDFVEWRADFFKQVENATAVQALLPCLREIFPDTPLLITYRSAREGGNGSASIAEYADFCNLIIESGCADVLDLELSVGDALFTQLLTKAHEKHLPVIASYHNFTATPSPSEMVEILCKMQTLGADIAKLAVMPTSKTDLLNLLSATVTMVEQYPATPVVTMSMGALGQASRVCGGCFGSAMTFASVGKGSAPGQIALTEMNALLDALYNVKEDSC